MVDENAPSTSGVKRFRESETSENEPQSKSRKVNFFMVFGICANC